MWSLSLSLSSLSRPLVFLALYIFLGDFSVQVFFFTHFPARCGWRNREGERMAVDDSVCHVALVKISPYMPNRPRLGNEWESWYRSRILKCVFSLILRQHPSLLFSLESQPVCFRAHSHTLRVWMQPPLPIYVLLFYIYIFIYLYMYMESSYYKYNFHINYKASTSGCAGC